MTVKKRTLKNCVDEDKITFDAKILPKQHQKRENTDKSQL